MLALSENGDNETVDMLVGDIYGADYSKLGLKSTMIASSFGKVFKKQGGQKGTFSAEDISKSLLYAISNNIGQIACVSRSRSRFCLPFPFNHSGHATAAALWPWKRHGDGCRLTAGFILAT